jgi:hypothetical protein
MASVIASLRPKRRGPFEEEELSLLSTLMPHLQRALALHRRLGWLHSSAHSAMTLLDRLPYGVVLLSADTRVVLINQYAKTVVDQTDGLTIRHRELRGCSWDSNKRLQMLSGRLMLKRVRIASAQSEQKRALSLLAHGRLRNLK